MMQTILLMVILFLATATSLSATERYIHSTTGISATNLPFWVAKDLRIFENYGLQLELLHIAGGPRGLQALLGGSTHSAHMAAMAPIRAALAGGDAVIVGAFLNKQMFNVVARKEIRKPSDLRGKKVGIVSVGGTHAFAIRLAFKEWNIPVEAVNLVVGGDGKTVLAALETGGIDATLLTYSDTLVATQKGMTVLADLAVSVPEFPDRTIVVRRPFLDKKRDSLKRFLQGLSEGVYYIKSAEGEKREKLIAIAAKHLKLDRKLAGEVYETYQGVFSFPPRVGRKGMAAVLDIIQEETGRPKAEFELNRFVDESVVDELDREGFFKRLEVEYSRK
jgi:ABC-type nitrate/sulfonate/bicarbonate transport system substrate-binding protein